MYTFKPMALTLPAELVLVGAALPVAEPVDPAEAVPVGAGVMVAGLLLPPPMWSWGQTLAAALPEVEKEEAAIGC
jgi:hypothetical protein